MSKKIWLIMSRYVTEGQFDTEKPEIMVAVDSLEGANEILTLLKAKADWVDYWKQEVDVLEDPELFDYIVKLKIKKGIPIEI